MKIRDLLETIDGITPFALAEPWDRVGLQIGSPNRGAGKVLVALEVTDRVLDEARRVGAQTIVAHHPLIFAPLAQLDESRTVDRLACRMVRENLSLIVAHTNLDSTADGTNGELADRLGLKNRRFLRPLPDPDGNVKFTVFVPTSHVDAVIEAVHQSGAGIIGDYSHCTFRTPGTGTYKPLEGANPYAGSVGELEHATDEVRLETVCPRRRLRQLIDAAREAHPYEEMAFDVYPLESADAPKYGLGLVGTLPQRTTLGALRDLCAKRFDSPHPGLVGDAKQEVETVAVCSGAGGEAVKHLRPGVADVLVTGEMNHHQCAEVAARGLGAILVGHYESEVIVTPRFATQLVEAAKERGATLDAVAAQDERPPLRRS